MLCKPDIQFLEGQAGGIVCAFGADQTLSEEDQVVVETFVKPCVDF